MAKEEKSHTVAFPSSADATTSMKLSSRETGDLHGWRTNSGCFPLAGNNLNKGPGVSLIEKFENIYGQRHYITLS